MKKRIMSALLAVCLILTVIPNLALEAKAATPTIQGKVVDTMGRPVPASISVSAQGNTSSPLATTTASETTGQFTLSRSGGFTDGTYVIKVEYSICVTTTTTISLSSSDGFIIAAPITMKLAGRASGTVTDAKTGTGISGVTVNVYTTGGSLMTSTTTGAGGKYKVETEQGSYNIEFSRSGYTTGRLKKVSLSVIETTHDMQLTPSSGGGSQGEIISGEIVSSGTWGKNISWTLDSNGCLVIKGQGDMITYGDNSSLPWRHNKNEITSVFIEDGVTGTGYGTLNCTYEEYENGAATQRINYYDIPIETGKEINATVSADGKNVVMREASGQTLSPNETVPAADYQKSTISISVSASGGDVQGAGKYVKGDSVQLLASPKTGYRFIGWQNQDGSLIEVNQLYEFTAKENTTITAVFARDTSQHSFTDVASDAWYAESVQYVYENGLMTGTSNTTFSPGDITTRGQLVTILYRMEGEPAVSNTDRFDDVSAGQWYTNAVAWAADNGIVSGYGNRKYGPHDGITREQMVTILHRYADSKKMDTSKITSLEKYTDQKEVSAYAVASMQWAVGEGLITGTSQTTLSPTGTSTRAQVAAILQRYGEKFPTAQ